MDFLLENEQTERLLFRKVRRSDFESWLPFHQDPRSSQYWQGLPNDPEIACREQFARIFERYGNRLGGMNALIRKSTNDEANGSLVGLCGLLVQTIDDIRELEIGYSILPDYWRKGYATEAARKCKEYAFGKGLAKSVISIIQVDNVPSQKVALNIGMVLSKTTEYKNNRVNIFRVRNT